MCGSWTNERPPKMTSAAMQPDRSALVQAAFRIEWLTAVWMAIEAVVAIWSGIAAHSLSLIAFGADSVIELLSVVVVSLRLTVEIRHGEEFSEKIEHRAGKIGGALLFALAIYVVGSAAWALWNREGQEFSPVGLGLTVAAIPIMVFLAKAKLRISLIRHRGRAYSAIGFGRMVGGRRYIACHRRIPYQGRTRSMARR